MGQAFDRDGNVLGEAFGHTKRDVLDKLERMHPSAHEIRIRTLEESGGASAEMPRYKCHKEVWALKIAEVRQAPADQERMHAGGDWYLVPEDKGYSPVIVGHDDYYIKHKPTAGGYYVVYADGYKSFSPAQAFKEGYTRL